jgi:RNA-directed DNA polymerase
VNDAAFQAEQFTQGETRWSAPLARDGMFTTWLVSALAKAFVAGEATPDAVVERSSKVLGRPWRWLRPLAVRYQKALAAEARPRQRNVVRFLKEDEGFCRAIERHRHTLEVVQWLPDQASMQPVAAAARWALPRIETAGALADWLEVSVGELEWFADLKALGYRRRNSRLRHYWYRVLQKERGHVRLIEAPKQRLKERQQRILRGILEAIPLHDAAHGFRKGRSIQTFCAPHVGQRVVVKMDLQDFFPAISGARLQSLFRTFGYPEAVADLLGGLCSNAAPKDIWQGVDWKTQMLYGRPHLPQGAPTSPALANLCAYHVDCRLRGLAAAAGAVYTRYADDMAFSGGEDFAKCAERFSIQAAAIAAKEGFAVHHRKTRIMRQSVRQQMAGLVVNERINVRRADFDELKAILTNCARLGPVSQNRSGHAEFRAHLQGRVAFVKGIHPEKGKKLQALLERIPWE